jgi:hypothetical protein
MVLQDHPAGVIRVVPWKRCTSSAGKQDADDYLPQLSEKAKNPLAKWRELDCTGLMIRPGFLDRESWQDLIELAREASAAGLARERARAAGRRDELRCDREGHVAGRRTWRRLYQENGIEGPASFGYEGGACRDCRGDRPDEVPSQTPQHPGHLEPIERLRGLEVPRNRHTYDGAASNCSSSPPRDSDSGVIRVIMRDDTGQRPANIRRSGDFRR